MPSCLHRVDATAAIACVLLQALIGCATAIKALVAQVEKPETESLWQEATSPDGKTYYWHTVTKFVSWVKPSELGGTVGDKVMFELGPPFVDVGWGGVGGDMSCFPFMDARRWVEGPLAPLDLCVRLA